MKRPPRIENDRARSVFRQRGVPSTVKLIAFGISLFGRSSPSEFFEMTSFLGILMMLVFPRVPGRGVRPQSRVQYPLPRSEQRYAPMDVVHIRGNSGDDACMSSVHGVPWEPIRITVRFIDLEADLLAQSEEKRFLQDTLIPQVVRYFENSMKVRRVSTMLLINPTCESYAVSSNGTRQCTKSSATCTTTNNQSINVPSDLVVGSGPGVAADYIMLITAKNDPICYQGPNVSSPGQALAFALSCYTDQCDRPIVGSVNICPNAIDLSSDWSTAAFTSTVVHEFMHAFGFETDLIPFFRFPNGSPRIKRDENRLPPFARYSCSIDPVTDKLSAKWNQSDGDYMYFFPNGLINHVDKRGMNDCKCPFDSSLTLSDSDLITCLTQIGCAIELQTPIVISATQAYYDCPNLTGAELENIRLDDCYILNSHWEFRNLKNEVMVGISTTGVGFVSPMTFAFFEDSGWYSMNYEYTTSLIPGAFWGYADGCDFINKPCIGTKTDVPKTPGEFCTASTNSGVLKCTPDTLYKSWCYIGTTDQSNLPAWFQYGPGNVGDPWADYCPVYSIVTDSDCWNQPTNSYAITNDSGEIFSHSSRCLESTFSGNPQPYASCYSIKCTDNGSRYFVGVAAGNTEPRFLSEPCSASGERIQDELNQYKGDILCADPLVVCTSLHFPHIEENLIGTVEGSVSAPPIHRPQQQSLPSDIPTESMESYGNKPGIILLVYSMVHMAILHA